MIHLMEASTSIVLDQNKKPLSHFINQTMMRINLPYPLKSGEKFSFSIRWWFNISDHVKENSRSGYEYFPGDGNSAFTIAQFFPRMAVYNEVEGWQNYQFWGDGSLLFLLKLGRKITFPLIMFWMQLEYFKTEKKFFLRKC